MSLSPTRRLYWIGGLSEIGCLFTKRNSGGEGGDTYWKWKLLGRKARNPIIIVFVYERPSWLLNELPGGFQFHAN